MGPNPSRARARKRGVGNMVRLSDESARARFACELERNCAKPDTHRTFVRRKRSCHAFASCAGAGFDGIGTTRPFGGLVRSGITAMPEARFHGSLRAS